MIQFKRGSTSSWRKSTTKLGAGQPGYDKEKHKIKVGDGVNTWSNLPYAGGLNSTEILDSEQRAQERVALDPEDKTLITYGTEQPNTNTVGQVYLQRHETESEVDRVVEIGRKGLWKYRKWLSGYAECWCSITLNTPIQLEFENNNLFKNDIEIPLLDYPFTFVDVPCETVSLQSSCGLAWLASAKGINSSSHIAHYDIISTDSFKDDYVFVLNIKVDGFWK